MWKICTKCKKHKALWAFQKRSRRNYSSANRCKNCKNKKRRSEYDPIANHTRYLKERPRRLKQCKIYRESKKERYSLIHKRYYENNKEHLDQYQSNYKKENRTKVLERKKKYNNSKPKFKTFKDQLTIEEAPRLAKDGISLEVKCKYCKKYFIPIVGNVYSRIKALKTEDAFSENNLYCSDECKLACPVFANRSLVPNKHSFREPIPSELRDEILSRNDGMCEICDEHPSKEVHHEKPVSTHPHLQLDKDNLWGLCEYCHYEVCHQLEGCTLPELRKKSVNNCSTPISS